MTREEITRRREMAERLARFMCVWSGKDPDAQVLVATRGRRQFTKPNWEIMRPYARMKLAEHNWMENQGDVP